MFGKERAFKPVCEILESRQERYTWKTAKYLNRQLSNRGCPIGKKEIGDLLIDHSRSRGRTVRYSSSPARKSPDLLWDPISFVDELKTLHRMPLDT